MKTLGYFGSERTEFFCRCNVPRRIIWIVWTSFLLSLHLPMPLWADAGQLKVRMEQGKALLQVWGDKDDEWRIFTSTNLTSWRPAPLMPPLLSGGSSPPYRDIGSANQKQIFYRAIRTEGLFDTSVLRTIYLSFTQANWQTLLANGRTTGSNTLCALWLDNGATNTGVGARYKGNSSFMNAGAKKSINLELDYTNNASDLMHYRTINLNNAAGDETIMREPLFFNLMRRYTVAPKASFAQLYINRTNWGVYSFVQQENSDMIDEWFPSNNGDRWKAPNISRGGELGAGSSALGYLGTNVANYRAAYELKTDNSTNAWQKLIQATYVLNNTPTNLFRDKIEEVLAVDRWLWFLAVENIFADDDSYFHKGADYGLYYEPESGRIHPLEHDGNEAFALADSNASPVVGESDRNRPVLYRLLRINELRQRYLAHMRTVLEESYKPSVLYPIITQFQNLTVAAIAADPKKNFAMGSYTNDVTALKSFIQQRYTFLTNHPELKPVPPIIGTVTGPSSPPHPQDSPLITAEVRARGTNGLDSVWLYHRGKPYGRFTAVRMFDDGQHQDGRAGDDLFGAFSSPYPSGTKVRFYIEARSAAVPKAAQFSPARAEQETYSYRVNILTAPSIGVVLNELLASNETTWPDPQGEFDDWIELRNVLDQSVDIGGCHLSDEPNNPRKWQFPSGTTLEPGGYLLVWADEDGNASEGLHASFKLAAQGESLFFTDREGGILDSIVFGPLGADQSFGRSEHDADFWKIMIPTPEGPNAD